MKVPREKRDLRGTKENPEKTVYQADLELTVTLVMNLFEYH